MINAPAVTLTPAGRRLLTAVAVCLGLIILAPILLSGQDLYSWARAPRGLNLSPGFAALVPVALDIAAAACIGMVIIGAVWRRERPGVFGLLVWVFAGVSAWAQYRHGIVERDAGRAQDAWWLFPGLALLGPTLLEVTLHRVRRWARQDAGEQHTGAAGFGARWLPGVAFRETLAAWAASRREGIGDWRAAVAYVRERAAVAGLAPVDALRYALAELNTTDVHAARVWLQARGVLVDHIAIEAATPEPLSVPVPAPPGPPALTDRPTESVPEVPAPQAPRQVPAVVLPAAGSKSAAIRAALIEFGAGTSAARIVAHLAGQDVACSEALVRKVRGQLAVTDGPGWAAGTGEVPALHTTNGHRPPLAVVAG